MTDYTYFDLFSVFAVSLSVLIAYFRGVTQEIFAILNWVFSGILSIFFAPMLGPHLELEIRWRYMEHQNINITLHNL